LKKIFTLMTVLLLLFTALVPCLPAGAEGVCISEVTLAGGEDAPEELEAGGYEVLRKDLNGGSGSPVYIGYRRGGEALTGLMVSEVCTGSLSAGGITWNLVSETALGEASGRKLWLYSTSDQAAGTGIVSLTAASDSGKGTWSLSDCLNDGSDILRMADGTPANLADGAEGALLAILMNRADLCRPYIDRVASVSVPSGADPAGAILSAGCNYYAVDPLPGDDGNDYYVCYTRTADASRAVTFVGACARGTMPLAGDAPCEAAGEISVNGGIYTLFFAEAPDFGRPVTDITVGEWMAGSFTLGEWAKSFFAGAPTSARAELFSEAAYRELISDETPYMETPVRLFSAGQTMDTSLRLVVAAEGPDYLGFVPELPGGSGEETSEESSEETSEETSKDTSEGSSEEESTEESDAAISSPSEPETEEETDEAKDPELELLYDGVEPEPVMGMIVGSMIGDGRLMIPAGLGTLLTAVLAVILIRLRKKKKSKNTKAPKELLLILLLAGLALPGLRAGAAGALLEPVTADFTASEAKEYSKPRGTALATDTVPFMIYDDGTAVRDENGLTLTRGYLTVQKNNPMEAWEGFRMEIRYTAGETQAEPTANQALLVMSAKAYGSTPALTDGSTLLGVAENGEVYVRGKRLNDVKSGTGLTTAYASVAPGTECVLTVEYLNGSLAVRFTSGGATTELVKSYICEISGIRQLTLGADKTTANRLRQITWKSISFTEYGEYVPATTAGLKAVVQTGTECTEFDDTGKALTFAKTSAKSGTFTLLELYDDWKVSGPITIDGGMSLNIDLNGHTIDRGLRGHMSENGCVIRLQANAVLTLSDSSPGLKHYSDGIPGGVITGGAGDDCGGGIELGANSKLVMTGGSIVSCVTNDHGGAIRVTGDGAQIYVSNAGFYTNMTLDSTDNSHGGAVYVDGNASRAEFTNTIFEGNYSEDNGGAIYMNDGRLILRDCRFTDNSCLDDGGAIYYESGSNSDMEGSVFLRNRSGGDGGAVYCNSGEETKLSGFFRENRSGGDGGAVHVNGGTVGIVDSEIRENKAGADGGGVYVDEYYDLNLQGLVVITDNTGGGNSKDNVFLDSLGPAEAHIYLGGLYEGSAVGVRTNSSNHVVCERISEYQKRYFTSDQGKNLKFSENSQETRAEYLISSVIGKGRLPLILAGGAALLLCIAGAYLTFRIKARKGGERHE